MAAGRALLDRKGGVNVNRAHRGVTPRKVPMSANVLPFPAARRTPNALPPERSDTGTAQPLSAPCRFTLDARNALIGLTYALPLWGVRFEEHLGDGGEWAAIFDTRGSGYAF